MTLFAVALFAVHHLAPWLPAREAERWAEHIAAVARDRDEALAMATTEAVESSFSREVERCDLRGKAGEVTAWQLRSGALQGHSVAEVCASPRLAARLGRDHLAHLRRVTGSWQVAIMRYVGAVREDDPRVRGRLSAFDLLQVEAPNAP